ncbi:anhydro-N-acetylmuramic acid kinase [Polymorphospora sp. NPDC051019]|uniref:anhydro-N-acetylmuramic acid kinase n=1 Tax=Polymorphospora sp. NPDC051019 TaxID=3155725 RepID=UPI003424E4AF
MLIVGMMSGTSYDAVDVAAARFRRDGDTLWMDPLGTVSQPFDDALRAEIAAVLPPRPTTIEAVCRLDTRLGQVFARAAATGVELAGGAAELVVSPGQTVFHWIADGRAMGTLQLGAPAWVAARTGLPVLSDLRGADIAAGGQGAPLVPAFDALLLAPDPDRPAPAGPRAALNLGGIANLTVVAPDRPVTGYDVGPANALIDAATLRYHAAPYDHDGRFAAAGTVDPELLALLLAEPYLSRPAPKSTGKELFHAGYLDDRLAAHGHPVRPDDVIATLTELTACTVAAECDRHGVVEVVAAGGGVRNPVLMRRLRDLGAGHRVLRTTDDWGIPAQAKEAYAFALLGWLSAHGLPGALPSVTGAGAAAVLGSWTPGPPPGRPVRPGPPPRRLRIGT